MVFSTNQVRQLYVATKIETEKTALTSADNEGTILLKATDDKKHVYFQYVGKHKNLMRSDLIDVDNILHAKSVLASADSQVHKLKQAVVTLSDEVNDGKPISGQDYILRICINPYIGMSDEEPYFKYGAVHATRAMAEKPGKFYAKLAASLYKNFSRELGKMLEFTIAGKVVGRVKTGTDGEEVLLDESGAVITVADTYTDGVTITEVPQEWTLGIKEQTYVNFTVIPTTVVYDGDEVTWGSVENSESKTESINNGKKIADLEYFCMGERGDVYRNIGWPNSIKTDYMVNADTETGYNIFEIHFAYVGPNEGPQRSERDLVIVSEASLETLVSKFAELTGVEVEKVTE